MFVLKLIAVVSMLVDHTFYVLRLSGRLMIGPLYIAGRSVGRPAFVIFCFLLVNGFDRTRDRKKYLARLVTFAVLSQLPFTLAFSEGNYAGAAEALFAFDPLRALLLLLPLGAYFFSVCEGRFDPSLVWLSAAFLLASLRLNAGGVCLCDPDDLNVFYTLAAGMALMMGLERLQSGGKDPSEKEDASGNQLHPRAR